MALPSRLTRSLAEPADLLRREMDDMFTRFFGEGARPSNGGGMAAGFPVDIRETENHLLVEAELPGFARDEIDLTVENQTLNITAERREEVKPEQEGREYLLRERRYRRYSRSFTLPSTVDENNVQARYENGILHIQIAKREETKPRKISVS